ncbi:MAG: universal stress protein [Desulfobacterales bacterium]|nr:universal stress protein [Pseudomonadota bacterium]MBU4356177.1 universal stress protein [Pseudomonadota bacterium]MCG2773024.1 universal stress protein [Desulfobacterales bacterium]
MKKRVLLAIDMEAPAVWAASYAVQLAARLKLSLAVMAVFPVQPESLANGEISPEVLEEDTRLWLGKIRERCQQEGVTMEIFISSGPFYEEVLRFSNSPSSVQFIIMGLAGDFPQEGMECSPPLQRLHQQFEGEVLLVRVQGKVARLADICRQNFTREN